MIPTTHVPLQTSHFFLMAGEQNENLMKDGFAVRINVSIVSRSLPGKGTPVPVGSLFTQGPTRAGELPFSLISHAH